MTDFLEPRWATPAEWLAWKIEQYPDIEIAARIIERLGYGIIGHVTPNALRKAVADMVTALPADELLARFRDEMVADGYFIQKG